MLGAIGIKTANINVEVIALSLVAFVVFFVTGVIAWYAHKHPREATLEGAEVIELQHQELMAAKGMVVPPDAKPVVDPRRPEIESATPKALAEGEPRDDDDS